MGRRVWLLCAIAACGRIDFHPLDGNVDAIELACPAGFVAVPGNAALGAAAFCAMQFEAKAWRDVNGNSLVEPDEVDTNGCDDACSVCDDLCITAPNWGLSDHVAVSVPAGEPWRYADQVTAHTLCTNLGVGFDLMSNREWMAIARNAELVGANWSSGVPGVGRLVEGNTDGAQNAIGVSNPSDPYSDTGDSAGEPPGMGWEQRRTLILSNGSVLWDLPGSMQEWTDWTTGDPLDGPPISSCTGAELPAFMCAGIGYDDFNSSTGTYDSTNGVGWILGGNGNAARRGGQVNDRQLGYAGIYALNMNRFTTEVFPGTGFRCIYRP